MSGEYGLSASHRDEAARLAEVVHAQVEQAGGSAMASDAIALAQLHTLLAIADALTAQGPTRYALMDDGTVR